MRNTLFDDKRSAILAQWEPAFTIFVDVVKAFIPEGSEIQYCSYRLSGTCYHSLALNFDELELLIMEDGDINIPDERNIRDMIRVGLITISTADSVDTHRLVSTLTSNHRLLFMDTNSMEVF